MPRVLALALLLACGGAEAGAAVTIALRPQVRVSGPMVTLGDVAVLNAGELEPLRTLANLPIGRLPAGGEAVVVDRDVLAGWVRARAGVPGDALHWTGAASTQVVAATRRINGEELAAAAETVLRGWLAARAQGSDLQLQSLPREFEVPEGPLSLRPRTPDLAAPRSRMLVWVEVWVAERFIRAVAVPFQVDVDKLLPVALGAAASPRDVRAETVVRRGQWASLRSSDGAVTLEARVEVLQDGRLGDSVRVRQSGAPSGVIARVTGPGQLEVAR